MTISCEYVSIQDSVVTGVGLNFLDIKDSNNTSENKYAGFNSVNSGGNSGWIFSGLGSGYAVYSVDAGNNGGWVFYVPIFDLNYLNIVDSNATPPFWFAGSGSVDGGDNTGWLFSSFLTSAATDSTALNNTQNSVKNHNSVILEPLSSAETQATQVNFRAISVENIDPNDQQTTQANFNSAALEDTSLQDEPVSQVGFISAIVEASTLNHSQASIAEFFSSVLENATYANTQAARANFNGVMLERTTLADVDNTTTNVFNSVALENIVVLDGQIPRGWFKVNDNQNPNWTPINNYQG